MKRNQKGRPFSSSQNSEVHPRTGHAAIANEPVWVLSFSGTDHAYYKHLHHLSWDEKYAHLLHMVNKKKTSVMQYIKE